MIKQNVEFTWTPEMTDVYIEGHSHTPRYRVRFDVKENDKPWILSEVVYHEDGTEGGESRLQQYRHLESAKYAAMIRIWEGDYYVYNDSGYVTAAEAYRQLHDSI